jgi:hypothetical protein
MQKQAGLETFKDQEVDHVLVRSVTYYAEIKTTYNGHAGTLSTARDVDIKSVTVVP